MMDLNFDGLVSDSVKILHKYSLEEIRLPDSFSSHSRPEKKGSLSLLNRFILVSTFGEFRSVLIRSPKIEIVTLFFFPNPILQLPVFAMEFVAISQQPIVAVLDAKCLLPDMPCRDQVTAMFREGHQNYPDLVQAVDLPDWYVECRSGVDFFIRPEKLQHFEILAQLHCQLWDSFTNLFETAQEFSTKLMHEHSKSLAHYKEHHRVNSPGLPLLKRSFGEEWTDQYLKEYLFS